MASRGRIDVLFAATLVAALVGGACGGPTGNPAVDPMNGRYRISSGGGALSTVQALTKRFSELHPGVLWDIENVGSDAAVASVVRGEADLGAVSRDLAANERGTVGTASIGAVGTAVGVNAANPLTGLTKDQIRDIFAGKITDWSQVGGSSGRIKAFVREPTSATREVFDAFIFAGKPSYRADYIPVDSNDQTMNAIHSFQDAISMLTLSEKSLSDPQIRLLSIDGVSATLANLSSGAYAMRRPLYVVFSASPDKRKPAIAALIEFIASPEGQKLTGK